MLYFFFFKQEVGNSHPPCNSLNTHPWYKCDYSVITNKITEINPNNFNGFYLNSKTVIIILPTVIMV